jgi:hypothetical protein
MRPASLIRAFCFCVCLLALSSCAGPRSTPQNLGDTCAQDKRACYEKCEKHTGTDDYFPCRRDCLNRFEACGSRP